MNNILFETISTYFIEREFQAIPTDCDTVKMFATFQKSSLYLINIIALDAAYAFDLGRYNDYKALTKEQFKGAQSDKIILLNIILMENPARIYQDINVHTPIEEAFVDIHWLIDVEKNELIIPSRQVNNVIGLEKDLIKLIDHTEISLVKLHKVERPPIMTVALILVNCLSWVLLEAIGGPYDQNNLINFGALYVPRIIDGGQYWRLFTSNYIHIGAAHLFFNCFSLFIFGSRLEKYFSKTQFFIVYTAAGLLGSVFSVVSNLITGSFSISAGASGAIYGLIGCIIMSSRLSKKAIDGLNAYVMGVFFILGMAFSVTDPNVDSSAHMGGFLAGLLVTYILLNHTQTSPNQA